MRFPKISTFILIYIRIYAYLCTEAHIKINNAKGPNGTEMSSTQKYWNSKRNCGLFSF